MTTALNTLGVDFPLSHMTSRPFSEPFPYPGDNNNSDSVKQQQLMPDHLYQTSSLSSPKYAAAAFVASSAGLGASDIDPMYNMARPEDLLDSLHHHLQLQQQQQQQQPNHHHQQQRLRQQYFESSVDPTQDLDLLSSAFDPCSVPSTSSSPSAIAPMTTPTEATTSTYLSFLPSFSSLPPPPSTLAPGISCFPSPPSSATGDEDGPHYLIDSTSTSSYGGLVMMESRRSMPPGHGHSSSTSSSSVSSCSSASSSLVSSPISAHFDESAVMLPAITACASCKRSHIKCDSGRPCQNCRKHPSKALTCRDATPKPRGRPKGGSKAAAEAIMLAKLYQQQHEEQQLYLQEQLYRHRRHQQQPGYVPRLRVVYSPRQPARSTYQAGGAAVSPQHQYLRSQGSPQSVSLDYHHAHSRSSPTSPATLGHRVIRLERRPSLPVRNHPYAMHSNRSAYPSASSSSSSPFIPSQDVSSSTHMNMTAMGTDTWSNTFSTFSVSLPPSSSSTSALTSMAQEFSHPSLIGSPNGRRGVVLAHHQGLDPMSLMQQQQQHRVAAVPLTLGGTLSRQTSITENNSNDPPAWLASQMLQQNPPPSSSSSMPMVSSAPLVAVSSSPAVSPCPSTVSTFSSASTTTQLMTFKQSQHALSEEREMIKEEEENLCIGGGMGIGFHPIGHHDHDSEEIDQKEEQETEEQGRCRIEAMLQQQQHEMQVELQFLQQRQQQLQQEQVQREQALVRLNLQKQQKLHIRHHSFSQLQQQNGSGPVALF
ncbi:hypothetical protein BG015_002362 [Linnemannia schmuckeri]|uniref:Zn(2)-C6 fungal-type domain-containing protein n=1 Tax=Linnemannia schmuckeri TaxID=64567 RepID=A0A9P5V6G6_9FUNG|nr:hypothetical protein BG015_002362 [Linnemannia schmuckeri]